MNHDRTIHAICPPVNPGARCASIDRPRLAGCRGAWKVQGNIVDHQYKIENDAGEIAEVGKKWFRVRDTYGIQVRPGHDDALVLAVVIVVDTMSHPRK